MSGGPKKMSNKCQKNVKNMSSPKKKIKHMSKKCRLEHLCAVCVAKKISGGAFCQQGGTVKKVAEGKFATPGVRKMSLRISVEKM